MSKNYRPLTITFRVLYVAIPLALSKPDICVSNFMVYFWADDTKIRCPDVHSNKVLLSFQNHLVIVIHFLFLQQILKRRTNWLYLPSSADRFRRERERGVEILQRELATFALLRKTKY